MLQTNQQSLQNTPFSYNPISYILFIISLSSNKAIEVQVQSWQNIQGRNLSTPNSSCRGYGDQFTGQ